MLGRVKKTPEKVQKNEIFFLNFNDKYISIYLSIYIQQERIKKKIKSFKSVLFIKFCQQFQKK